MPARDDTSPTSSSPARRRPGKRTGRRINAKLLVEGTDSAYETGSADVLYLRRHTKRGLSKGLLRLTTDDQGWLMVVEKFVDLYAGVLAPVAFRRARALVKEGATYRLYLKTTEDKPPAVDELKGSHVLKVGTFEPRPKGAKAYLKDPKTWVFPVVTEGKSPAANTRLWIGPSAAANFAAHLQGLKAYMTDANGALCELKQAGSTRLGRRAALKRGAAYALYKLDSRPTLDDDLDNSWKTSQRFLAKDAVSLWEVYPGGGGTSPRSGDVCSVCGYSKAKRRACKLVSQGGGAPVDFTSKIKLVRQNDNRWRGDHHWTSHAWGNAKPNPPQMNLYVDYIAPAKKQAEKEVAAQAGPLGLSKSQQKKKVRELTRQKLRAKLGFKCKLGRDINGRGRGYCPSLGGFGCYLTCQAMVINFHYFSGKATINTQNMNMYMHRLARRDWWKFFPARRIGSFTPGATYKLGKRVMHSQLHRSITGEDRGRTRVANLNDQHRFLAKIDELLERGIPVIADVVHPKVDKKDNSEHYVLVVGRDRAGEFLLRDPGHGHKYLRKYRAVASLIWFERLTP